jgi:plasmid stabilization system protein ParE
MKKEYKTFISRYAEDDLIEIIDYFYSINQEYSMKLLITIENKIDILKTFPQQGRIVPELEKQNISDYRELIEGNYRIIYSIQEETVFIHTIVDSRRNLEEILIKKLMRYY